MPRAVNLIGFMFDVVLDIVMMLLLTLEVFEIVLGVEGVVWKT
jgi:hypothetical protein